ncbi:group II intron reverse transcriptase/maturase [Amycolatopsis nalaikhensis]|uniref:Group II intron reverse transcriptase/maturase n=1 Tax=Amycolatopsis nalaikhensis TaxID=715472 RepID=A0ABY8XQM9_9PSEU|nr:group II intron reverse transcriptase/maturase [Amycolatopsis sp. 2-2]WIV57982.1 group II intron reverse transcriptase/maturase [Amycolatopsis sp. 2-2]
MNTDALEAAFFDAERRVLEIQAKLHRWAVDDPHRRFDDLYNLVADPAFLLVAWFRVRSNKGARTAGVDGMTAHAVRLWQQDCVLLEQVRAELKAREFRPMPVRAVDIPKTKGKVRRLGIPTVRDRVVQAVLKLVLEPIFEADFRSCSYGFRPNRRAQDAVTETWHLASNSYEWIVEGDIEACFDRIDHTALMDRVRHRIADKRVLSLIKAFLKAGILGKDGQIWSGDTGTPQGGILSPLLANVALSVLDEHFDQYTISTVERAKRRRHGLANYRLVRYADDFVIMVSGNRAQAEALLPEVAEVLAPMGLRLSAEKTMITHIDEGLDFLGWRIRRHRKRGTVARYVYTYPSKKALRAIMTKVKVACLQNVNESLADLLHRLNPMLRGWTAYFRPGVSNVTFEYLRSYVWRRVMRWIRKKHRRINWEKLRRRYCTVSNDRWWPADGDVILFNPASVSTTRYRYRGTKIPSPWPAGA